MPTSAEAVCVRNGETVICDGFDTDGFVSGEDSLSVTINESGIIRNILTVNRRGICPLSFPAIVTGGSSSVTNDGFILTFGVCGSGIQTGADATVTNTGIVDTFDVLSFGVDVGAGSRVTNDGAIRTRGFVSAGVFAGDRSVVINSRTGLIQTSGLVGPGILTQGRADIINDGVIRTTGEGSHGIESRGPSTIVNSGSIEVGGFKAAGVHAGGHTTHLTNNGLITGSFLGQIFLAAPEDGISVSSFQTTVINAGSISMRSGSAVGLRLNVFDGGSATLSNSGTISAPAGGIFVSGSGNAITISNTGSISGTMGPAIHLDTPPHLLALITNQGSLSALGEADALRGGAGREEVVNSGHVTGRINLAGGNDLLTLQSGSTLESTVDGGFGYDDLVLNGSGEFSFQALNFEELTKFGEGLWQLDGSSLFSERIRILQGSLGISQNARVSSTVLNVFEGGTLSLAGTVAASLNNAGITLATQGALVDGDFVQESGGTLSINLGADETIPPLRINGAAHLGGRLRISPIGTDPILDGSRVVALSAESISGNFTSVEIDTGGFVSASSFTDGSSAGAEFNRVPYESAAQSINAISIARALDRNLLTAPDEALTVFTTLDAMSIAQASQVFNSLSSALPLVLTSLDIISTRNAMNDVMDVDTLAGSVDLRPGTWGVIGRNDGSMQDGSALKLSRTATRYTAGAVIPISLNTAFSIGLSAIDYKAQASSSGSHRSAHGETLLVSATLHKIWGSWRAGVGLATGSLDGGYIRDGALEPSVLAASASRGTTQAASGEVSKTFHFGQLQTRMNIGLTYVRSRRDATSETGSILSSFSYATLGKTSVRARLTATGTFDLGRVSPSLRLGLSHEMAGQQIDSQVSFVTLPNAAFELSLKPEEPVWVESDIQIPFHIHPGVELSLQVGGVLNDRTGGYRLGFSARWLW